jgi:hypothetical protein
MNKTTNLFKEVICEADDPIEIIRFLGEFEMQRLRYAGTTGRNPGYLFRGEIGFPIPLQSSLERKWFIENKGKSVCEVASELIPFEKTALKTFIEEASEVLAMARQHGHHMKIEPESCFFWWLSLMQHYRTGTRLLDFTKDILIALYFALEHYCQKHNAGERREGLLIYCMPCKDLRTNSDDDINKCPFRHKDDPINMHDALGWQIGLPYTSNGTTPGKDRYMNLSYQRQTFGWDRDYWPNPRQSFQKGMQAYPFKIQNISLESTKLSWFCQCLAANPSDPFCLGTEIKKILPVKIKISQTSVKKLLDHVQNDYGLTPAKVYLDCGKTGSRLEVES